MYVLCRQGIEYYIKQGGRVKSIFAPASLFLFYW